MTQIRNVPTQETLNEIFMTLLEAEIADEQDLPCKAISLTAKALLALNLYTTCILDEEQTKTLNAQKDYL